ncbi:MAG TPA: LptF/LptG family permease, partial [Planctomycetota bacterium]|nr:LptF/LptG family permease [Planctomycetota bacterium]
IVIDIATHLSFFEPWRDGRSASTVLILEYYVLSIPFFYVNFSPFVTVVAGIFTVSRLVKKNELSAGLSAGVSAQRLLSSVFVGSLLAAAATFGIREGAHWIGGPRRDALSDMLEEGRDEAVYENFRFRANADGDVVAIREYHAGNADKAPEGLGFDVTLKRGGVVTTIVADRIVWVDDGARRGWKLDGGVLREVGDVNETKSVEWLEPVQFTPEDVLTAWKARSPHLLELSFSQLLELSRRDPDNTSYLTLLQYLLTFPLANIVLVLCTVPILVGRERGKGGGAVMGGLLLCMAYFSVDFVTRSMGLNGGLSPLMSAWLPVLFFGALGISLTHFMRT